MISNDNKQQLCIPKGFAHGFLVLSDIVEFQYKTTTIIIQKAIFHECFINWMRDCHCSVDKDIIAIDGKTLRHSNDKNRRRGAIHVICAFSTMHSLVLGQLKTEE